MGTCVTALVAGFALLGGTAVAQGQNGVCEDGEFCAFRQINFDWAADFTTSDVDWSNNEYPLHAGYPVDDSSSSWFNATVCTATIYSGQGRTGSAITIDAGADLPDLRYVYRDPDSDWNNVASGHVISC
ncbi:MULTISPECIES: peptidase inhibitor family I36 protein [unclassified Streptomyces]|uniref:peptidase inhibitor family I36 protein n=1 Tax=unclassified Streptomyces TaxID=2593676 RepID=UPI003717932A